MLIHDEKECSPFTPEDTIEQGTIIKFPNNDEEEKYGIIVTGDCDIHNDKYGKYLSYCTIFTLKKYIELFYIPKTCKTNIKTKMKKLKELLIKEFNCEISDSTFDYILNYSAEELDNNIKDKDTIKKIIDLKPILSKKNFDLTDLKALGEKNLKNVKQFPGDKFYFTNLPDPDIESKGFVINLRRIKEINLEEIKKTYEGKNTKCFAIAKLDSPYKQYMTQTLGAMFSDIGLPHEYEEQREVCIENISKELFK